MKIFVINSGSSSLKFQLMDPDSGQIFARGICDHIGNGGELRMNAAEKSYMYQQSMPDHLYAFQAVIQAIADPQTGVIQSVEEIDAIGHRVLHGGEQYNHSCLIDEVCIAALQANAYLGPLHYHANLAGIKACQQLLPGKPQAAVFDTAFHSTMPPKAYLYALPEIFAFDGVRKHGFHGISHRYISQQAESILNTKKYKLISCHLGSGSSVAAVCNGSVMDTSMGMSPLSGLPMGTRSGDIDPCVVQLLCRTHSMTADQCLNILNKQSGVLALSEYSNDFRDLLEQAQAGDKNCSLALEKYCYETAKYIGAYTAALNGLDILVFTAGIGEHSPWIRQRICDYLGYLGILLDPAENSSCQHWGRISAVESALPVWVIPANEELVIAQDTEALVNEKRASNHIA